MLRASVLLLLVFGMAVFAHDDHEHAREAPHYKYSREANVGHESSHQHMPKHSLRDDPPEQLWLETFGAVSLISLAPFILLCFVPDLNKHQCLLKILLAFAAGGLLGDAFLHLIPHAIDRGHAHTNGNTGGHDHKRHMMVGLSVVSGIFVFLCIEKLIRLVRHNQGGHSHSHAANQQPVSNPVADSKSKKGKKGTGGGDESSQKKGDKKVNKPGTEFKVAGYLNLAADFTHNFTDGMAIGASFLISRQVGIVTTLTVLMHELPHEIGDYAILIQSGCSARKAMFLQLTTAVGAALGAALSLVAAGVGVERWGQKINLPVIDEDLITGCILPFTAGGFIYIAMTSVLPDLLTSDEGKRPGRGCLARMAQSIAEVITLVAGIGMMAALGAME